MASRRSNNVKRTEWNKNAERNYQKIFVRPLCSYDQALLTRFKPWTTIRGEWVGYLTHCRSRNRSVIALTLQADNRLCRLRDWKRRGGDWRASHKGRKRIFGDVTQKVASLFKSSGSWLEAILADSSDVILGHSMACMRIWSRCLRTQCCLYWQSPWQIVPFMIRKFSRVDEVWISNDSAAWGCVYAALPFSPSHLSSSFPFSLYPPHIDVYNLYLDRRLIRQELRCYQTKLNDYRRSRGWYFEWTFLVAIH